LSDRVGRRPAMIGGVAIFVAASVVAALATSIEMLVAARFVQALGACAGPVLGRAIVRDTASGVGVAQTLAVISGALALAPTFGLAVGGVSQELLGWRGCFMLLAGLGAVILLWTVVALPETTGRRRRTTVLCCRTGNSSAMWSAARQWRRAPICGTAARRFCSSA